MAILSEEKSKEIFQNLQKSYPFNSWSRIDWEQIRANIKIVNTIDVVPQIKQLLGDVDEVFILWSTGSQLVLKSQLCKVLSAIDDVLAVGADTFIYSPSRFIIEFHHEGEIIIGFENDSVLN
ncbi:hypothetical protein BC351_13670 [Paenibacillus ferrarius]|uniref:Uncharacterized protein n=2 Tax=Paenibacillus ferrarius TaxID=1469647 RepID=A0A1V4H7R0_9BACL|nr:hypothetical protein [Paenibacillus ferrarius]OPH46997.1 hypothetical protein BC351_13670 [Paenibacillus ferrarius]